MYLIYMLQLVSWRGSCLLLLRRSRICRIYLSGQRHGLYIFTHCLLHLFIGIMHRIYIINLAYRALCTWVTQIYPYLNNIRIPMYTLIQKESLQIIYNEKHNSGNIGFYLPSSISNFCFRNKLEAEWNWY